MQLQEIQLVHEAAFFEAMNDYAQNDPETYSVLYKREWNKKQFQNFVNEAERSRMDWRPKAGKCSLTRYVLIGPDGRLYGNGVMRFPLDAKIENNGGNLIFDVPPSLRRQGFGAVTLNRMLFEAVRAGLARVLVSCPLTNAAARRCIEKNRGELEREDDGVARYWIRLR